MSLSGLSVEILLEIFRHVERSDLLHLRLISHQFDIISTPIAFSEIRFELMLQSLEQLHCIASDEHLRKYVRTLVLRRRRGLIAFRNFQDWEDSLDLEDEEARAEWHALSLDSKKVKYDEYQADVAQALDFRACLAFRDRDIFQPIKLPATTTSNSNPKLVAALQSLDLDIARFSNLETFIHEPGWLLNDDWGLQWGNLQFDPIKIVQWTDNSRDWDIEALQLSYTLRALGWAREDLLCFHSIRFSVDGPAFWTTDQMVRLWDSQEELPHQLYDTWGPDFDLWPLMHDHQQDLYFKQLSLMEHACTRLRRFDLTVSEHDSLEHIVGSLIRFFHRSDSLESLQLVFGELAFHELIPDSYPHGRDYTATSKLLQGLEGISPWGKLRNLELELIANENALVQFVSLHAKTLKRLKFNRVVLTAGSWESALRRLASAMKQLEHLIVSKVRDYNPDLRIVLGPDDVWEGSLDESDLQRQDKKFLLENLDSAALFRQYHEEYKRANLALLQ